MNIYRNINEELALLLRGEHGIRPSGVEVAKQIRNEIQRLRERLLDVSDGKPLTESEVADLAFDIMNAPSINGRMPEDYVQSNPESAIKF